MDIIKAYACGLLPDGSIGHNWGLAYSDAADIRILTEQEICEINEEFKQAAWRFGVPAVEASRLRSRMAEQSTKSSSRVTINQVYCDVAPYLSVQRYCRQLLAYIERKETLERKEKSA